MLQMPAVVHVGRYAQNDSKSAKLFFRFILSQNDRSWLEMFACLG